MPVYGVNSAEFLYALLVPQTSGSVFESTLTNQNPCISERNSHGKHQTR